MKSLSLFLAGLALVILPSFVLAAHPANYTTRVQGISTTADCNNIPGAKFHGTDPTPAPPGADDGCWLPGSTNVQTIGGALGLVNKITNWLVAILVLFGIFFGIAGAFQFLSSGGDDKKLTEGKKKIYYAVGGVALGLLVKGIITLLVNFVGTLGA
jgi:hypothetical protein